MSDSIEKTGERRREALGSNVFEIKPAGKSEKVGKLKTQYDDVGDIKGENLIQIVDANGKKIERAVVSFERVTVPDLITEANIDLETEKSAVEGKDVTSKDNQAEIKKQLDEEVLSGLIVELFREYLNKTGGEVLKVKKTSLVEPKMGNPVTLATENTYIIARTGAETMKNYLKMGIPRSLTDGREVSAATVVDKKLEGRDLGFSTILKCGETEFKFDFIFGDEEIEAVPAKTKDQALPLAA